MLHQHRIEGEPVPLGKEPPERRLRLPRGLRADDAQPIREPVHVGVDRDRRDPVAEDEHAVGGLGADPRQGRQLFEGARDDAREPVEDLLRARSYGPRLRPVEPDRADQRLDVPRPGAGEAGGVGEFREEPGRGDIGLLVARPLRQDGADQHLERVLGVVAQVRAPPVARPVERREPVEQGLPVERDRAAHRRAPDEGGVRSAGPAVSVPGSERSGSSGASRGRRSSPIR